ncbi:hypothetical protein EDB89DRAFT_2232580 [Lactarius sanguifluus]|nr:hypothetical protein EDB89DRAFT_2232580 [Lactarius sanguifluus]
MADYTLWYFVEGDHFISKVTIPKDKFAIDLIREMLGRFGFSYRDGIRASQLVLLKVDIDLKQYLGDICELRAPDNAKKISPMEQIKRIWPDGPIQDVPHVHVCVKLPAKRPQKEDDSAEEDLNGSLATMAL